MGIKDLWTIIGPGETRSIAAWSTSHFTATGRPLRIAVDEANWRYKSLNDDLEAKIKRDSPGSQPREKRILERIFHILALNVQLVFVFDGPHKDKPARGGSVGVVSEHRVELLKRTLDFVGVPRHDAPGDAEAECVRMQRLGTVDAVWSDDSDAVVFGCGVVVRFHREGEFKSKDVVDVYELTTVRERTGLSQEGILMFALLVGSDFDPKGSAGCGKELALKLAKQQGLAERLAAVDEERRLSEWRAHLAAAIRQIQPGWTPPKDFQQFPQFEVLMACKRPRVSAFTTLSPSALPPRGWYRSFGSPTRQPQEMVDLYRFLLEHFNSRLNRNWPAKFLVQLELNDRLREGRAADIRSEVQVKPNRRLGATTTITINDPLAVLPELGNAFMIDELEGRLAFDPLEFELLTCVLHHGLPETASASASASSQKWKQTATAAKKRQKASPSPTTPVCGKQHARPQPSSNNYHLDSTSSLRENVQAKPKRKRKPLDKVDENSKAQHATKRARCGGEGESGKKAQAETKKPVFKTYDLPWTETENEGGSCNDPIVL